MKKWFGLLACTVFSCLLVTVVVAAPKVGDPQRPDAVAIGDSADRAIAPSCEAAESAADPNPFLLPVDHSAVSLTCRGECFAAWKACRTACGGLSGDPDCLAACSDQLESCQCGGCGYCP